MLDMIATPFEIGDIHKLKEAGASSVVIATPFFSARGAAYFPRAELKRVKSVCEQEQINMYMLVNRFFTQDEMDCLTSFLQELKQLNVEGIYYGDESVLYEAKKLHIEDRLIYAPDTLMTNDVDVNFYLEEGIRMVSISREITKEEICDIAKHTNGNIEVTIHGRVNMMHSKRHLISNYLTFIDKYEDIKEKRSLYIMEETRDEHMPIIEDALGTHVFSGYTLASFREIKAFVEAGVKHVKIDGIFHDIDYVCEAVKLYQDILHGADAGHIMENYQKKYEKDHVTNGFYDTKTSKVKAGEVHEKN